MKGHPWCALVLLALAPAQLGAQVLRGTVTETSSSSAVPGVVVLIIDSAGGVVGRALSGSEGEFVIALGKPGPVRVRTLRLGFRPTESPVISLGPGEERSVSVTLTGVAARLDAIMTTASTQCRHVRSDSMAPASRVLEQISTTLYATDLTSRRAFSQALNVRIIEIDRLLDPGHGAVLRQEERVRQGLTISPWSSLPPRTVHDSGYVTTDASGTLTFFAPDLAVLVSPEFVEDHCFRIAAGADGHTIRMEFEPVRSRRRLPEIRGVMTVDARTSELRRLDFEYVNLAPELQSQRPGGHLTFVRAASDVWLISGWAIRLPVFESRDVAVRGRAPVRGPRMRIVATAHREHGAELGVVMRGRDTLYASRALTLAGRIIDSASGAGIAGAAIRFRGTGIAARSDGGGRFTLAGVLPGTYIMEIRTAELEPWGPQTRAVSVTRSDTGHVVRLPPALSIVRAQCGDDAGGAVVGRVIRTDSTPAAGVHLSLTWAGVEGTASRDTVTDLQGFYHFCGVPFGTGAGVAILSAHAAASGNWLEVSDRRPIARFDVVLDTTIRAGGILRGRVIDATSGAPVPNAAVSLVRAMRTTVSDSAGTYRLMRADSTIDTLRVRRLGFRVAQIPVRIPAGQVVDRDVALERVTTLDTVEVRESPLPTSFYDHQRVGLGQFLTRNQLERQEHRRLSEVLSTLRGVGLIRTSGNQTALGSARGPRSLMNQKCFQIEGTTRTVCGCFPPIYVDGIALFDGKRGELPDLNLFSLMSIEAVEFYSGPSQTPPMYSNLDTACGVLVIHTRR